MSDLPSISVITPTLNQAQFIRQTIDSVIEQHYPRLEYIVIDGGSTDGTREILQSYDRYLTWISESDQGQSSAINKGWNLSKGEILCWLNSDDYYLPDALNTVGEYFNEHPEIDLVYGDCDFVDSEGTVLRPYPTHSFDYKEFVRLTENYIPQPAAFIRRNLLEDVGYLDETLSYVMDFDYWLRIGLHHRVKYLPKKLSALRLHHSAKSVALLSEFSKELVQVYQKLFSWNDLPKEIVAVKTEALANIYFRASDCSFWGNAPAEARKYALNSIRYQIWPLRGLWLWVALGRLGIFLANKIYKNPYFA